MGTSRWSPEDWDLYASASATRSAKEIFSTKFMNELNPLNVRLRESCDSDLNPLSTPIIVAVDVTGSMGYLAETLIRNGLALLIEEIYNRKPVTDPHVMCMAIGDAWFDRAPLQVTQFETDMSLIEQLSRFWIEGGGGANRCESYNLPWYFAATRTRCDAMVKRNKKGYLFTVGDEPAPPTLLSAHTRAFLGDDLKDDLNSIDVLKMAQENWEVFHIMIEQGSFYKSAGEATRKGWQKLLGQRAIALAEHEKLAELIVSTIQVNEGADLDTATDGWAKSTALIVRKSLAAFQKNLVTGNSKGLMRF